MSCNGPVRVRRASPEDASGIARVYDAAWQASHAALPVAVGAGMRARAHEASWRDELEVEPPDRAPWVALMDGRLVGFASGGIARDDDARPGVGEVYQLYVDPVCWRLGIGSSLLRHLVKDLHDRGFEHVQAWVLAGSEPGRAFMKRHTWTPDGASRMQDCGGAQVEEVRYRHALR
jgi:L-amino acid N-acyltransferase YncA